MIKSIIQLRLMLERMERDLGLSDMSTSEKCIYFAAQDLKSEDDTVETKDLIGHPLTAGLSRPTFFRGLKKIQSTGLLKKSELKKTGEFKVI
jgi:hypothetical protein